MDYERIGGTFVFGKGYVFGRHKRYIDQNRGVDIGSRGGPSFSIIVNFPNFSPIVANIRSVFFCDHLEAAGVAGGSVGMCRDLACSYTVASVGVSDLPAGIRVASGCVSMLLFSAVIACVAVAMQAICIAGVFVRMRCALRATG